MTWILGTAAAILAWLLWLWRPRPEPAAPAGRAADPYAAQVAEFRRAVNDYSRG